MATAAFYRSVFRETVAIWRAFLGEDTGKMDVESIKKFLPGRYPKGLM